MSQDVERWKADLAAAGWTAASATAWWDPTGGLYRGPYGAWKELQRRKGEIVSEDKQTDNQPALQRCPFCSAVPSKTSTDWYFVRHERECLIAIVAQRDMFIRSDHIPMWETRARVVDGVVAAVDQFNAWINNYWPDWRKGSQAKVELMRAAWDAATRLANFNELALKGCHEYTVELEKVQALAYQMARHIRNTDEIPAPRWGVEGIFLLEQLYGINPEQYEHEVKAAPTAPIAAPAEGENERDDDNV